jgi:hypothetical protein
VWECGCRSLGFERAVGEGTLGRGRLGIGSRAGGLWDGRECVSLRAGEVHFGLLVGVWKVGCGWI